MGLLLGSNNIGDGSMKMAAAPKHAATK